MVQVNFSKQEVNVKLVYYGPEAAGKSTSLHAVEARSPKGGRVTAVCSEVDRTLFFEYLQMELGRLDTMRTKLHLYTVPPRANACETRKAILRKVDGVVFVADSRPGAMEANLRCVDQLREDLVEQGYDPDAIPVVFQWNKRDLAGVLPIEDLNAALNHRGAQGFASVATRGEGILPTLKQVAYQVLKQFSEETGFAGTDTRKVPRLRGETRVVPRPAPEAVAPRAEAPPLPERRRRTSSARFKRLGTPGAPRHDVVGVTPTKKKGGKLTRFFRSAFNLL